MEKAPLVFSSCLSHVGGVAHPLQLSGLSAFIATFSASELAQMTNKEWVVIIVHPVLIAIYPRVYGYQEAVYDYHDPF